MGRHESNRVTSEKHDADLIAAIWGLTADEANRYAAEITGAFEDYHHDHRRH